LEGKNISKNEELEKKEKKNEKYIDIELGKEEIDVYVNATLTKIVIEIKMSLNIMDEIDKQKDIYYRTKINNVNKNMLLLLNSYKVLFIRKLANLLLSEIYSNYSESLIKVTISKKNIIVVKPDIKEISEIPWYQINLLIDFLRFIWEKCSSAIYINDDNFPLPKEIFYEYLKIIKKNLFSISLSEPEKIIESDDKINENELKKIIQENMKEIDISSKIEKLIGLIKINQEGKKNSKDNITEINGEFLYKLWKK
jgi:hypothetical protein